MSGELELERLDAATAAAAVDDLVDVYLELYGGDGDPFHSEDRFRRQVSSHMAASGWQLVMGRLDGDLVGYTYGFTLAPATAWWDGLTTPVPDDFTVETGTRTFAISEVMVRQTWRRQGHATTLVKALLDGRSEERATCLVRPDNTASQAMFAALGWEVVAQLRPGWEHAPLFDVLVASLSG